MFDPGITIRRTFLSLILIPYPPTWWQEKSMIMEEMDEDLE